MKGDPKSNFTLAEGLSALSRGVATYYTAVVDHALAPAASFAVSCGTFNTSFVATLQWSNVSDSGFVDEADTSAGNTVSLTLTEAGSGNVHCPNPRGRYTRLKVVIGGTNVFGVSNISGPLRHVAP